MELSAIYHRTESEYAYLYKDKKLHIRIRTKKGTLKASTCIMATLLSLWRSFIKIQRKWLR